MKKWFKEYWGYIVILSILFAWMIFLLHLMAPPETQQRENGWYEATIFCDGNEIIRGQLLDLDESRNSVKVNISGETYIVSKNNIIIHFIPYD